MTSAALRSCPNRHESVVKSPSTPKLIDLQNILVKNAAVDTAIYTVCWGPMNVW